MIPLSATTSKIENEVYRHRDATNEEFDNINAFYRQVLEEDKELCVGVQTNLSTGVFINGELHPSKEKVYRQHLLVNLRLTTPTQGPIHFQQSLRDMVMEHRQKEEAQGGREIWPALPAVTGDMKTDRLAEEERFCSQLEASCMSRPELAW